MSQNKRKLGLVGFIVGIMAAIIITFNVFQVIFATKSTKTNLATDTENNYHLLSAVYADYIEEKVDKYTKELQMYTTRDVVSTANDADIVAWLQSHADIRSEDFDYVAYVDAQGNFNADNLSSTTVTDRSYFIDIMQKGKNTSVDDPVASKVTGKTIIHICLAAKANGKTIGFFNGIVDLQTINSLVEGIKIGKTGVGSLVSSAGEVVASAGNVESVKADVEAAGEKLSNLFNTTTKDVKSTWAKDVKGQNKFYTVTPIEGTPWFLLVSVSSDQVYETAVMIRRILIICAIIMSLVLIISTIFAVKKAIDPLTIVESAITDISTGHADLTKRIRIGTDLNNEIGDVVKGFNTFTKKLQDIIMSLKNSKTSLVDAGTTLNRTTEDTVSAIGQIIADIDSMTDNIKGQSDSVTQTAGAVNEIASNIDSLDKMIESQAKSVKEASNAIEEMVSSINSIDTSVSKMADSFEELSNKASTGIQKQDDVNKRISSIEAESKALQEANSVISSIAEQTNLLAMNAAIEAAHAGEAGKGFSVVADEIRKLSETSSSQSKTIGDQLKKITKTITGIVSASNDAGGAFSTVAEEITNTNNLVQEIKYAMRKQEEGSHQITLALGDMNNSTSEVRAASAEMSQGNKAILEEITKLQNSMIQLHTTMDEMTSGSVSIKKASGELAELSSVMEESIKQIGNQVDLFKV